MGQKILPHSLVSANHIESVLIQTYTNNPVNLGLIETSGHPASVNGYPLLLKRLIKQIHELGRMPGVLEFSNYYSSQIIPESSRELSVESNLKYFAYRGYLGLVRDLHFYMLLLESNRFDEVISDIDMDVHAKQDIIVAKSGKRMGIQLFKGITRDIEEKRFNAERSLAVQSDYEDYYFPLNGDLTQPKSLKLNNGESVQLYSKTDVKHIEKMIFKESPYKFSSKKLHDNFIVLEKATRIEVTESTVDEKLPKHSLAFLGPLSSIDSVIDIKKLLNHGVKIEIISDENLGIEHPLLRHHILKGQYTGPPLIINDGKISSENERILIESARETSFNYQQFLIEHAPIEEQIMVDAGAGSGKTTTMIARILFLLNTVEGLSLRDIVMITFTREAADHMRKKIMEALVKNFKITKDKKYLKFIDSLADMRIHTIDAFSKYLFQRLGTTMGWGQDVNIGSYVYEQNEIFKEEFAKYLEKSKGKDSYSILLKEKDYKLYYFFREVIEAINKKGHSPMSSSLIWDHHQKGDKKTGVLLEACQFVVSETEKRLEKLKLKENKVSLSDMNTKLNNLKEELTSAKLDAPIEYLFVDEFQDTDDSQIYLIETIMTRLGTKVFVVGDIKQSIYRFRGANSTAFQLLEQRLKQNKINFTLYNLNSNYRTNSELLNWMENIFDVWRREKLLPQQFDSNGIEVGRLVAQKRSDKTFIVPTIKVEGDERVFLKNHILKLFQNLPNFKQGEEISTLGILVRENWQVKVISGILEEMRKESEDIAFEVSIDGGLYTSKAAKDLLILLNSLRLKGDPSAFFAVFQTPFVNADFDFGKLFSLEGSRVKLVRAMSDQLAKGEWEWFRKAQEQLRYRPGMNIFYDIIEKSPFENILRQNGEQEHEILRYRKNLIKILSEGQKTLNVKANDIHTLHGWLKIQVSTNRNQDEAEIFRTMNKNIIRVMTVHKAKGLEFDSVLLPYTKLPFVKVNRTLKNQVVVRNNSLEKKGKLALQYKWWNEKMPSQSSSFAHMYQDEEDETILEEARLLYVAMTRVESRLSIVLPKKTPSKKSWANLIDMGVREFD